MSSRLAVVAGIGLGAVALGYAYSYDQPHTEHPSRRRGHGQQVLTAQFSKTPNTDSKASPANQTRRGTDTIVVQDDISLKGVERSGGGV